MLNIGITGQSGFIGTHLYNNVALKNNLFNLVPFKTEFFKNQSDLDIFVSKCDVIVHLAAMNRHGDQEFIYDTNISLVNTLIRSLNNTKSKAHIIYSSSIQEENDSLYGKSKKDGRLLLAKWCKFNKCLFTGLIFPNLFGPFGNIYHNSFIATFSHLILNGEKPKIDIDNEINLLYIQNAINTIIDSIITQNDISELKINYNTKKKVSEILKILLEFQSTYFLKCEIPFFKDQFEIDLFNTFRSYINLENFTPFKYNKHIDERGVFSELIRQNGPAQISFSVTNPNKTRGNHYHTRKIERFSIIKGTALIQLRRVGTTNVFNFKLNGDEPSYIDIPIWYTHNITNIGNDDLYTIFWINEYYNADDSDTYFQKV